MGQEQDLIKQEFSKQMNLFKPLRWRGLKSSQKLEYGK